MFYLERVLSCLVPRYWASMAPEVSGDDISPPCCPSFGPRLEDPSIRGGPRGPLEIKISQVLLSLAALSQVHQAAHAALLRVTDGFQE